MTSSSTQHSSRPVRQDIGVEHSDADLRMMRRCVEVARESVRAGEFPFAAVVARRGEFVCESINRAKGHGDVNCHAEAVALAKAQQIQRDLSDCTLYASVEPCALCAYAAREARIGRVVYGLRSPLMGGHSRWNILGDDVLANSMPDVFSPAPAVVAGLLQDEVAEVFKRWNPLIWRIILARGIFVTGPEQEHPRGQVSGFAAMLLSRMRSLVIDRIGRN